MVVYWLGVIFALFVIVVPGFSAFMTADDPVFILILGFAFGAALFGFGSAIRFILTGTKRVFP